MKIVVLGVAGQLGSAILTAAGRQNDAMGFGHADLDVSDSATLRRALTAERPDVIVNASAFARVDDAEDAVVEAFAVNAIALRTLARVAVDLDATLVHYSTDFVFDGAGIEPNTETIPPNPSGAYATSKLVGEWFAADAPRHFVFRVESLFGGAHRKSSIDNMLANIVAGRRVAAFCDRTVSPSYVVDVAEATLAAISRRIPFGLYHCVNSGATTWSGLAHELARLVARPDADIVETRMANVPMRVRRPLNAALSNAKLRDAGIHIPTWQDALARHVGAGADEAS